MAIILKQAKFVRDIYLDGCINYWKLNHGGRIQFNLKKITNNGTVISPVRTSIANGISCLFLDASTAGCSIVDLIASPLTLNIAFYLSRTTSSSRYLFIWGTNGDDSADKSAFGFIISSANVLNAWAADGNAGNANGASSTSNEKIFNNQWCVASCTYDNSGDRTIRLYINAREVTYSTQRAATAAWSGYNYGRYIGAFKSASDSSAIRGCIAEASMYNRVLANEEIYLLHSQLLAELSPKKRFYLIPTSIGTATLTGTVTTATEADIVAGGKTIVLTLTGDTWMDLGIFDGMRQDLIDGLTSSGSEANGWNNEVRDKIPVTDVVRTSDTVATITLSAEAGYNITADETITATIPAGILVGGQQIVASPTFTVTATAGAPVYGGHFLTTNSGYW